jgi:Tfp pilus assembly protein PilO
VVVVGGLLILGFGYLGFRAWQLSSKAGALESQADALRVQLQQQPASEAAAEEALGAKEAQLQQVMSLFSPVVGSSSPHPETDSLVQLITNIARTSGIQITSLALGERQAKVIGTVRYETQLVTVTMQGLPERMSQFLSALRQEATTVAITDVRIVGIEGVASAQAQLLFHLSPQLYAEQQRTPSSQAAPAQPPSSPGSPR